MCTILYWSPYHGQGQTSNLHATALIMSMLYKKKTLLMQTHFAMNNLEGPLVGMNIKGKRLVEDQIFQDIGLDAAVTFTNMDQLNYNVLESCCFTFPETSLLLLPGTQTKNKETFHWDIGKSVVRVIENANECVDMIFVDANSGNDELSLHLMKAADLIVINLTQRKYILDNFFDRYGDYFINKDNVFYLFGDYDENSSYNIDNCRLKYRKYIKKNNSGTIPYSTQYMDAQNEGDAIKFIKEGLRKDKKERNFIRYTLKGGRYSQEETDHFFQQSKSVVEKMLTALHIPEPTNHREGRSIRVL